MLQWLVIFFDAVSVAAIFGIGGVAVVDRWLWDRRRLTAAQGRHRYALWIGFGSAGPLGAYVGQSVARSGIAGEWGFAGTLAVAVITMTGAALFSGVAGFVIGLRLARRLGVSNQILVRPVWALFRVAVPFAIVAGAVGVTVGWIACQR